MWALLKRLVAKHAERLRGVETDFKSQTDFANATAKEKLLVRRTHQTLKRVTNDFDVRWHFNTSVALVMELVNEIQAQEPLDVDLSAAVLKRVLMALVLMISPMTPHIAEELWGMLGIEGGIDKQKWPGYREDSRRRSSSR